jgi:hypothetical protein
MMKVRILLAIQAVLLTGCGRYFYPPQEPAPHTYYLNPAKEVQAIGRVALIELSNKSTVHQISPNMTDALFQEIQKRQLFGVRKVAEDDPAWRSLELNIDMTYSYDELAQMRQILKCDAVLMGTITGYEPYPHMAVGLRLRLIDLSDGQLVWAMEQVWDTTDKTTRNRIEWYYSPKGILVHDENLSGQLGSISSLKFFKFVAYEITQTLQP